MKSLKSFSLKVLALMLCTVLIFGTVPLYANDNVNNEPSGGLENAIVSTSDSLEIILPSPHLPLVIVDQGNGLSDEAALGAEPQEKGSSSEASQEITIINEAVEIDSLVKENSPIPTQSAHSLEPSVAQLENIYNPENYKDDFVPGEVLVGMKPGVVTPQSSQSAEALFPGLNVASIEDLYQTTRDAMPMVTKPQSPAQPSRTVYLIELALETKESVLDAIEILKQNPNVAYAEPNYIVCPDVVPNDPFFGDLWGMKKIQAPEAWDLATGSHSVRVGVLDTGFNYNHPDLTANLDRSLGYYVAQNAFGLAADISDYDGHGTHVAGTIGARGNNGIGVVGVNWNVTMVPIKIAESNSSSNSNMALMTQAIIYSTELGLPVVSMSYGIAASQAFTNAIRDYKGLFVKSAGNSGLNRDNDSMFVALHALGNVIFVANTDSNDTRSATSCYGTNTVALAAPGTNILSTYINSSGYQTLGGTSMAAPHVSGAAALLLSRAPNLTTAQLKNTLLTSVDTVPSLTNAVSTGGRLNVNKAIRSLSTPTPTGITVTTTGLSSLKVGQTVSGASVVYTLTGGTYATPITASHFTVGNLPPGLSAGTAQRTSNTVVTIPITGTPTTHIASAVTLTRSTSIPAANVTGATTAIVPTGTITASAVAKGDGSPLNAVPTAQSTTTSSITVGALSLTVATGQS
ncbi:MAG: S8 family serine peptidase, partial [Coriobacteriia bacterium]|nr:S8 family serine peptidase [Coriobacteriia bacterium]